jgi:tryptophan 2,3-dioxygenase
MELTYSEYLKLEDLLNLQVIKSNPAEHDEMLFIVIHQTYELWFKQIIHEIDYLSQSLEINNLMRATKTIKRINTILKVLVHQVDILETITPLDFLSFRNYLESASGFQSYQFRELEFLLGYKRNAVLQSFEHSSQKEIISRRYYSPVLWDHFLMYLFTNNLIIDKKIIERDYTKQLEPSQEIQSILIEIYLTNPEIAQFCELMLDFDEGLQEWRYRHVKMVERTIGQKTGTGGSPGVKYLQSTLFKPVFPDLWLIRTRFENV